MKRLVTVMAAGMLATALSQGAVSFPLQETHKVHAQNGQPEQLRPVVRDLTGTAFRHHKPLPPRSGEVQLTNTQIKTKQAPATTLGRDESGMVCLTIGTDFDFDRYYFPSVWAFPEDELGVSYEGERDYTNPQNFVLELEPGVYDLMFESPDSNLDYAIYYLPGVEVSRDMILEWHEADLDQLITFEDYMYNGQIAALDLYNYNLETEGYELVTLGNAQEITHILTADSAQQGLLMAMATERQAMWDGEEYAIGRLNVRINNSASGSLHIYRSTIIQHPDGADVVVNLAKGLSTQTVSNQQCPFSSVRTDWAPMRYKPEPADFGDGQLLDIDLLNTLYVEVITGWGSATGGGLSQGVFRPSGFGERAVNMSHSEYIGELNINVYTGLHSPYGDDAVTLPCTVDNTPLYLGVNNVMGYAWNLPDKRVYNPSACANPMLSFSSLDDATWYYGCPVQVFTSGERFGSLFWDCVSTDRIGTKRGFDIYMTSAAVEVDGKQPNEEQMEQIQWGVLPEGCTVKFDFCDENVLVDGVEGYNKMTVEMNTALADFAPPTLQLLRTVDGNGELNDHFTDACQGTLQFYAGKFTLNYSETTWSQWYIGTAPASVKVEYAPTGSEDFCELQFEELPEFYFMPGFGHFYEASLAPVTELSEDGWFDVRITLSDTNGNNQVQTLSPVFHISSLVSAANAVSDKSGDAAIYYNVNGVRVDNPSAPGIYIELQGSRVRKVRL